MDDEKDAELFDRDDLEDLTRLQLVLDQLSDCASTSQPLPHARRVVRVPCSGSLLPFTLSGGASEASLISIESVVEKELVGVLFPNDILLSVDGLEVSGMVRAEVVEIVERLLLTKEQFAIEITPAGCLPTDICEILSDKRYSDLQQSIRNNVYSKTVPFTTRPPREGEVDGEHYRFVSSHQFNLLLQSGQLLEHGCYEGHLYGTPRPTEMVSGSLGPLPPNWEIAYADNGEKYFIDHNHGRTQWNDPRDLPVGWEQVDDPVYGTFYVDHMNKRTQYERPLGHREKTFTRSRHELKGEIIRTSIVKGPKGLGFTLIGNDSSSQGDEFIQVKSIIPNGLAELDGVLQPGDVLVSVNGETLLGARQADACRIFVACPVGHPVSIEVCRGYPLILDPSNRIVTENVYSTLGRDMHSIEMTKGLDGFGFTIADSINGQRVKKVLHPSQCPNLQEGDIILELDGMDVRATPHQQLVDMLRMCPPGHRSRLIVKRSSPKQGRSRTPTAAFRYGEQRGAAPTIAPRSKTPAPQRSDERGYTRMDGVSTMSRIRPSSTTLGFSSTPNYMPISAFRQESNIQIITVNLIRKPSGFGFRLLGGTETGTQLTVGQIVPGGAAADDGRLREGDEIIQIDGRRVEGASHSEAVALLEQAAHVKHVKLVVRRPRNDELSRPLFTSHSLNPSSEREVVLHRHEGEGFGFIIISSINRNGSTIGQIVEGSPADGLLAVGERVVAVNGTDILNLSHGEIVRLIKASGLSVSLSIADDEVSSHNHNHVDSNNDDSLIGVDLARGTKGFGFSIRGGQEFGAMPLFVLRMAEDGPAARDGRLRVGDELVAINGRSTTGLTHEDAINLIKEHNVVRLTVRRRHIP